MSRPPYRPEQPPALHLTVPVDTVPGVSDGPVRLDVGLPDLEEVGTGVQPRPPSVWTTGRVHRDPCSSPGVVLELPFRRSPQHPGLGAGGWDPLRETLTQRGPVSYYLSLPVVQFRPSRLLDGNRSTPTLPSQGRDTDRVEKTN